MSERLAFDNNVVIQDQFHLSYPEVTLNSINSDKNFENEHHNSLDEPSMYRKRKFDSLTNQLEKVISMVGLNRNEEDLFEVNNKRQNTHVDNTNTICDNSGKSVVVFSFP
jgi:hypothetical protein